MNYTNVKYEVAHPAFDAEKYVRDRVNLWNTYDLSLVDSLFLLDSRLTDFSSEKEGLIKGIEAVREHHRGFGFVVGGKKQANKLWVENMHTQSFGSTATVQAIWYFRKVAGDSSVTTKGTVSFVYVAVENEYRIGVTSNFI